MKDEIPTWASEIKVPVGSQECLSGDEGETQTECFKHPSATLSALLIVVCWNPTDECRAHPQAMMHHRLFVKCQEELQAAADN